MDEHKPKPPKFKLLERPPSDEIPPDNFKTNEQAAVTEEAKPLSLRKVREKSDDEALQNVDDMLESAHGAEKRAFRRKKIIDSLKHFTLKTSLAVFFFVGTLVYAHSFAAIPVLKPPTWYLPFFLSAAFSSWLFFQSARFWAQAYHLVAIFGIACASALVYWNLFLLKYAVDDEQELHSRLTIPRSAQDLFFSGEFDELRGVPRTKSAYARISAKDYRRVFYALPRDQWRDYFERYLGDTELKAVNVANIDKKMHEVARRLARERAKRLDEMEAQINDPPFALQCQQIILKPYTWLIGYL
jgi:hypothetical protein